MTIETVPDVIRFILDHRRTRTVPDGFRGPEPVKPEPFREIGPSGRGLDSRSPEYQTYLRERAAYDERRDAYDALMQVWRDWKGVGDRFTGWNGDGHRHQAKVEPSDLYPTIEHLLGVSPTKAKSMTSTAFHAGEIIRLGGGSNIAYTLPEIVNAQAQAAQDLDVELRALAAHAESLGIKVHVDKRGGLARSADVAMSVADVVALIEAAREGS